MAVDVVRVWDAWGQEVTGTVTAWDSWEKVKECKGFPGGLIAFLQTDSEAGGCGFLAPTLVQAYAWPVLTSGRDLVGVAKTGSGKTLAFLLPGFIKLRRLKKSGEVDTSRGPALLALTPTRELCHQIFTDTERFGKPVNINAACAYGGAAKRDQEWAIKEGRDCLIATPGRLNDFVNSGVVNLDQCRFAVLDEADRMLDMGFEPQIRQIMDKVSPNRQTAMFTATWPKECRKLAEQYVKEPMHVQIGSDEVTTNQNIRQHVEVVNSDKEKMQALKKILRLLPEGSNCLVFCNTKKRVRDFSWELNQDRELSLPSVELHGDLDQWTRDNALNKFRSGEARVLVATDLAARGLDIRNVAIVVNYDVPNSAEDYIHRIGRTGRATDMGDAYTLLNSWGDDARKAGFITSFIEKVQQEVPQALRDLASSTSSSGSWTKNEWGKSDSWSKDDWKKDEKKDAWEKDEWKKDDWGKGDWSNKDDRKKEEWNKGEEWKKDDWKKEEWKNDEWKADDWKQQDWKEEEWKKEPQSGDWKQAESSMPSEPADGTAAQASGGGQHGEAPWRWPEEPVGSMAAVTPPRSTGELPAQAPWPGQASPSVPGDEDRPADDGSVAPFSPPSAGKRPAPGGPGAAQSPPGKVQATAQVAVQRAADPGVPDRVRDLVLGGAGVKLKVAELEAWLVGRGLPTSGTKAVLLDRIKARLQEEGG